MRDARYVRLVSWIPRCGSEQILSAQEYKVKERLAAQEYSIKVKEILTACD